MYIPQEFSQTDRNTIIAFMQRYPFATLVTTAPNGLPQATHLPFNLSFKDEKIILTAHIAKANPQWEDFKSKDVMVIFSGPHAYISPSLYERQSVPTWNYIAVHAYGKATIVTDPQKGIHILEQMMDQSESAFMEKWKELPQEYISVLFNEIVPFEIEVTKLDAQFKLSQNKTTSERQRIIEALEKSDDSAAKDIADHMKG